MHFIHKDTGESAEAWPQPHAPKVLLKTAEVMVYVDRATFSEVFSPVPCRRIAERRATDRKHADRRALLAVMTPEERVEWRRRNP
jgi:hypothetical protein